MEDPDFASCPLAKEDPDPTSVQAEVMADPDLTSLQAAMEDPITASLGPVGPLLRKLHSILPRDEIHPLKELCISLKNLSEDEDASPANRRWMKIARELVYDSEDHLDEASGAGAPHDFSELLARVKNATERRARFQWSPPKSIKPADRGEVGVSRLTPTPELLVPISGGHSKFGVVQPPQTLVQMLAVDDDRKTLKVIPIHGCAGVGKTTVARALYHKHGGKFQCRAFVSVSRNPDMRAFLSSMLSQLKAPQPHGFPDVPNLIDAMRKYLQDKRYLIVVDDLWTASVWDIISTAFPHGDSCSRIITTTHIDDVALACCSYESDYIYKMEPLNDHESRVLFFSEVLGSEDGCPTDIKEVSHEIIRKCGGLPLAIVSVASILASEPNIAMEKWKHIQDFLPSTSEGMKDVVNHIYHRLPHLIYNSLPPRLRTCLLSLSMYPQGCVIKKDELLKHWVAEGFFSAMGGGDAEKIAGAYFKELVSRGLVQAVDANNNGDVLSCTVHQMVLDFIRCKSLEENFVINVDYFQSTLALPDKVRRLSIQFGGVKSAYIPESIITSHVRSLIFSGFFKCVPSLTDFGLLRILILHIWADQDKKSFDLTTIGKIYQLKYIKIECNITVKLPSKIRRLQHLGTLHVDARLSAVPSDIVNLERLLHLCLPSDSIVPSEVAQMASLRTLGYFDLSSFSEEAVLHLGRLTNLQDLQLTCSTEHPGENLEKNVQHLCSVLEKLSVLQSVTLAPASASSCAAGIIIPRNGFSMVSPPPDLQLQRLELSRHCCIFSSLPEWMGDLVNLSIIKVAVLELSGEDLDVLKGLPSLTALTLYIHTSPAERIFIDKEGFEVLTYFKFMCAAPCLSFVQGAMPKVQRLNLGFNSDKMKSYSLQVVGFHYLTWLTEISVKFGARSADEFDLKAAESTLEAAVRNHPNKPIIRVQRMDVILDGEGDKSTVTEEKEDTASVNRHEIRQGKIKNTQKSEEYVNRQSVDARMAKDELTYAVVRSGVEARVQVDLFLYKETDFYGKITAHSQLPNGEEVSVLFSRELNDKVDVQLSPTGWNVPFTQPVVAWPLGSPLLIKVACSHSVPVLHDGLNFRVKGDHFFCSTTDKSSIYEGTIASTTTTPIFQGMEFSFDDNTDKVRFASLEGFGYIRVSVDDTGKSREIKPNNSLPRSLMNKIEPDMPQAFGQKTIDPNMCKETKLLVIRPSHLTPCLLHLTNKSDDQHVAFRLSRRSRETSRIDYHRLRETSGIVPQGSTSTYMLGMNRKGELTSHTGALSLILQSCAASKYKKKIHNIFLNAAKKEIEEVTLSSYGCTWTYERTNLDPWRNPGKGMKEVALMATVSDPMDVSMTSETLIQAPTTTDSSLAQNDLLDVYPLQLRFFPFKLNKAMCCPLRLTNRTDDYVLFRFRPYTPGSNLIKLYEASLPPRSTCTYVLRTEKLKCVPNSMDELSVILQSYAAEKITRAGEYNSSQDPTQHGAIPKAICDRQPISPKIELILTEGDDDSACSVDVHPTEPRILAGHLHGNVSIWNYQTQEKELEFKLSDKVNHWIYSVIFIAREKWFVAGDRNGYIHVVNITMSTIKQFQAHEKSVESLAVHPSRTFVLSASWDMLIKLWNWDVNPDAEWECVRTYGGHTGSVYQAMFNPYDHGHTFASASSDGKVKIWSTSDRNNSPTPIAILDCGQDNRQRVAYFSSGGQQYIFTGSKLGTARVWDLRTNICIKELEGYCGGVVRVVDNINPLLITISKKNAISFLDAITYESRYPKVDFRLGEARAFAYVEVEGKRSILIAFRKGIAIMEMNEDHVSPPATAEQDQKGVDSA